MKWRIHHKAETASTNIDARGGIHGDVFTADFQTAGRGRLDHKWFSPAGANLMMSSVLSVQGRKPEQISTFPLVVGLAVARGLSTFLRKDPSLTSWMPVPMLKWPNDVLIRGRKIAGILCELDGEKVIAGIGVNVKEQEFPPEIKGVAISLEDATGTGSLGKISVPAVRDAILGEVGRLYEVWVEKGFAAIWPEISEIDLLKGRSLVVRQTDDDSEPIVGVSGGIQSDGALDVGGIKVYAGEAHVVGSFATKCGSGFSLRFENERPLGCFRLHAPPRRAGFMV